MLVNCEGKVFNIVFWICPVISVLVAVLSYGTALGVSFPADTIVLIASIPFFWPFT